MEIANFRNVKFATRLGYIWGGESKSAIRISYEEVFKNFKMRPITERCIVMSSLIYFNKGSLKFDYVVFYPGRHQIHPENDHFHSGHLRVWQHFHCFIGHFRDDSLRESRCILTSVGK